MVKSTTFPHSQARHTFQEIGTFRDAHIIAGGDGLAYSQNDGMLGVGRNNVGQLGDGTLSHKENPVDVSNDLKLIHARNNLIAHYPFDGNATDAAGRDNDGIVVGAIPAGDRFNDANSSYDFDTNDLVLVHNTANFPHGNSTRTISVWIKPLPQVQPIIKQFSSTATGNQVKA